MPLINNNRLTTHHRLLLLWLSQAVVADKILVMIGKMLIPLKKRTTTSATCSTADHNAGNGRWRISAYKRRIRRRLNDRLRTIGAVRNAAAKHSGCNAIIVVIVAAAIIIITVVVVCIAVHRPRVIHIPSGRRWKLKKLHKNYLKTHYIKN